ncbi:hypothetical protein CY0110_19387 [Crocosphaera chwakensis CCY0110]|uniref:Uncharacterized protein n=1 Tax=Crocosphaera chwakensis CCY0110 TaxID=391612 RepID=A3IJK9_9CHRO|nr:hypothetical protein CY0110_19387 [Crocosphaera chwakensis CCY0110]
MFTGKYSHIYDATFFSVGNS